MKKPQILAEYAGAEGGVVYYQPKETHILERAWFTADGDIDADGANGQENSRPAYMVNDHGSEYLANGGMQMRGGKVIPKSSWYKDIVITDRNGNIKIFEGGIIASKTSYRIAGADPETPDAYLCSELIPYIVVPPVIVSETDGVVRGCLCRAHYRGIIIEAMMGDVGPRNKLGEISIAAARLLGLDGNPRSGGIEKKAIMYEVFPGTKFTHKGITYPLMRSNGTYV